MDMKWLHLFQANLRKEFIELKRYLPNTIAMLVTFYLIFLGMFAGIQVIGDPGSQDLHTQYAIVNDVFWFLAFMVVNNIGYEVINEGMRGTLEQLSMSPLGIWRIMTARLIASTLLNFIMVSRSEEHTSELQSRGHLVCRLLLEKKKSTIHDR